MNGLPEISWGRQLNTSFDSKSNIDDVLIKSGVEPFKYYHLSRNTISFKDLFHLMMKDYDIRYAMTLGVFGYFLIDWDKDVNNFINIVDNQGILKKDYYKLFKDEANIVDILE